MQKDVIYIDVEDDITAIIGKVKQAKSGVVALVPPKRIGVLQSAVNLRLLQRAGDQNDKRVVLITNNAALLGLASAAKIPVAKNLQSKPEIPEINTRLDNDDDDIIDGEQLPVGDHAKTVEATPATTVPDSVVSDLDIDNDTASIPKRATPPTPGSSPVRPRAKKSGIKVPSFSSFRKKALIFGGLGALLIVFLVWAIWFAPYATVTISAKTSNKDISSTVTLGTSLSTDASQGTLKSIVQTDKETNSVDFTATGSKDAGTKATGTVRFSSDSYSALMQGITIPVGTILTSTSGKQFTTTRTVQLSISAGNSDSSPVTAVENGDSYNGASGSVSGGPNNVSASLTDATSGGTTKTITIVLQADVEKAKAQLESQDTDTLKSKLKSKFGSDAVVIDESFTSSSGAVTSSPAIGAEASGGTAKLTSDITYTMTGVSKNDLDSFLKSSVEKSLSGEESQRVYDTGLSTAAFSSFKQGDSTATATLKATSRVGPQINDDDIKNQVKGKKFGEIQSELKQINGVEDAETTFSPFWVQTVPNDSNKIKIEFKLTNGS